MATTRCRTCGSDMQVPLKYVHSEPQCLGCAQDAHDNEAEHLATAERAVIDAAVERRKKANLLIGANRMSAEYERAYDEWDAAQTAEDAAVDALLAARGKP